MSELEEIEKLFKLKEKGVISEKEFETQKAILLGSSFVSSHVSPVEAFKDYWRKSFVCSGRANLPEYWWPFLFNMLIGLVLSILFAILSVIMDSQAIAFIPYLYSIITLIPNYTLLIRRFHDLGKSAMFALTPLWLVLGIALVALCDTLHAYIVGNVNAGIGPGRIVFYILAAFTFIIVFVIWFVFLVLPGQKIPNKYGDPK